MNAEEGNTLYDVRNRRQHRSIQTTGGVRSHYPRLDGRLHVDFPPPACGCLQVLLDSVAGRLGLLGDQIRLALRAALAGDTACLVAGDEPIALTADADCLSIRGVAGAGLAHP